MRPGLGFGWAGKRAGVALLGAAAIAGVWQVEGRRQRAALGWIPPRACEEDAGLHVRRIGRSGPVLLLLHGLTASGRFWGGNYEPLAECSRLVIPDLLGFGGSPRPEAGYGADEHVDAILECLRLLGLADEPLVIGAHSLGTLVALRLAVRRGNQVRSIAAFSPPLYADRSAALAALKKLGPMARISAIHERAAHVACNWVCAHRRSSALLAAALRPELPSAIAIDSVQHTWPSFSETLDRMILAAEGSAWLHESDVPVRLIAGERDRVIDRAYLTQLAVAHGNVTFDVWPGAGHLLPLGRAEEANALLRRLLRDVA